MVRDINTEIQQRLGELQAIFRQQLPAALDELRLSWGALEEAWSEKELDNFHRCTHRLAGSSATFGAHELSQVSRALEIRLKEQLREGGAPTAERRAEISQLLQQLYSVAAALTP